MLQRPLVSFVVSNLIGIGFVSVQLIFGDRLPMSVRLAMMLYSRFSPDSSSILLDSIRTIREV